MIVNKRLDFEMFSLRIVLRSEEVKNKQFDVLALKPGLVTHNDSLPNKYVP